MKNSILLVDCRGEHAVWDRDLERGPVTRVQRVPFDGDDAALILTPPVTAAPTPPPTISCPPSTTLHLRLLDRPTHSYFVKFLRDIKPPRCVPLAMAMALPAELIDAVADHIADAVDLRTGALVHRDWTPGFQRKLFYRVTVGDGQWRCLKNLLRVSPHLRSFVCELVVRSPSSKRSPRPHEIGLLFPCVSTVDIHVLHIRLLNHLPSLTRLVFCHSRKQIPIKQEWCKLRLESVTFDHRYGNDAQGPLLEWLCRGDLRRLRSADFIYWWNQHEIMAQFLNQADHLQQLNIYMRTFCFSVGQPKRKFCADFLEPLLTIIA
jgi:hypothetical protein